MSNRRRSPGRFQQLVSKRQQESLAYLQRRLKEGPTHASGPAAASAASGGCASSQSKAAARQEAKDLGPSAEHVQAASLSPHDRNDHGDPLRCEDVLCTALGPDRCCHFCVPFSGVGCNLTLENVRARVLVVQIPLVTCMQL